MKRALRRGGWAVAVALLAAVPARAVDKDAVNAAVEKGVRHIQGLQSASDGIWPHEQIGLTALCGLTLLECGVPTDDGGIQKAAAAVRTAAVRTDQTYSIALCIMFLDRLGESVDVALIESLTVRLLAGQLRTGGWTYACPKPPPSEERRLTGLVRQRAERGPDKQPPPEPGKRTERDLAKEVQGQLDHIRRARPPQFGDDFGGDNSNTQFAVLGLWTARKYGLPVDRALELTDGLFRRSTNPDGGWPYLGRLLPAPPVFPPGMPIPPGTGSTPAMTCSGLLGIGLNYGILNEAALRTRSGDRDPDKPRPAERKPRDPSQDKVVVNAFRLLGTWVDAMARGDGKAPRVNNASGKVYYFLWSLERVCVAYGLEKVGKTDWYDWAADILLANQGPDGAWNNGEFRGGPDTCFALLVLKRADLVKGLNRALTSQMKGGLESSLKAGGVSGADLVKGSRKPFFENAPPEETKEKPNTGADAEAARLGAQLASAEGDKRERILKELRESKGAPYTDALAAAIPKLEGEAREKAREALADRLSRMTATTLEVKLSDDDPEVRRAAALAVAMKEDRAHAYRLIELLSDPEATVARAAHAALKSLSGEDFGPAKDATREERGKAILAWKDWLRKQGETKK